MMLQTAIEEQQQWEAEGYRWNAREGCIVVNLEGDTESSREPLPLSFSVYFVTDPIIAPG